MVKNLPTMQETWVQSLGQEDHLEKERATHSSILAWEIPWTVEPGGPQSMGLQRIKYNLATKQQQQQIFKHTFKPTIIALITLIKTVTYIYIN